MLLVASNWVTDLKNVTTIRTSDDVVNITFKLQISGTLAWEPRQGGEEEFRWRWWGKAGALGPLPLPSRAWIKLVCFHLSVHGICTEFHTRNKCSIWGRGRNRREERKGEGRKTHLTLLELSRPFMLNGFHHYTLRNYAAERIHIHT